MLKKSFSKEYTETVAVKTLKGFMEKKLVTDLLKECAKMKELDHPNVLKLKGVCLDGGPAIYAKFIVHTFAKHELRSPTSIIQSLFFSNNPSFT